MTCGIVAALRRAWERIAWGRVEAQLAMRGERRSAHPFDAWSQQCVMCGGDYEDHQAAALDADVAPAIELVSLVANGEWDRLAEIRHGRTQPGTNDVVTALALRCPRRGQLAVFVAERPYEPARPSALLSQQILGEGSARALERVVAEWRPAMVDRLASMQQSARELRENARRRRAISSLLERGIPEPGSAACAELRESIAAIDRYSPLLLIATLYLDSRRRAGLARDALRAFDWEVLESGRPLARRYLLRGPGDTQWTAVRPRRYLGPARSEDLAASRQ